jgi:hypothetical protein
MREWNSSLEVRASQAGQGELHRRYCGRYPTNTIAWLGSLVHTLHFIFQVCFHPAPLFCLLYCPINFCLYEELFLSCLSPAGKGIHVCGSTIYINLASWMLTQYHNIINSTQLNSTQLNSQWFLCHATFHLSSHQLITLNILWMMNM